MTGRKSQHNWDIHNTALASSRAIVMCEIYKVNLEKIGGQKKVLQFKI